MNKICYLCGKPGADTKDHVPPKCFLLKGNFGEVQRITLFAHKTCNNEYSADEEYLRDIIGPASVELDIPKSDEIYSKTQRAWKRQPGFKRYQELTKTAKIINKVTSTGIYTGRALAIQPDRSRINRIGKKIARGMIYSDSGVILSDDDVNCVNIPIFYVTEEKEKELKNKNQYWIALTSEKCKHDMFHENVAVRRIYQALPTQPEIEVCCFMGIVLWAEFFVVITIFPISKICNKGLEMVIDNSEGEWIHNPIPKK